MKRFRKYRENQELRDRYADVPRIVADNFIYPYFVLEGQGIKTEIKSMKGVYRFSIDQLLIDIDELISLGINKVLLFGVVEDKYKDERGTAGYAADNLISKSIKAIKNTIQIF